MAHPTPDDVRALPPGPELDALCAELVMGWKRLRETPVHYGIDFLQEQTHRYVYGREKNLSEYQAFHPSRHFPDLERLLEEAKRRGWSCALIYGQTWQVEVWSQLDDEARELSTERAPTLPEALTKAMVLAAREEATP